MREFETAVDVALPADRLWALRDNEDFEQHLADYEKQNFSLVSLSESKDDQGDKVNVPSRRVYPHSRGFDALRPVRR